MRVRVRVRHDFVLQHSEALDSQGVGPIFCYTDVCRRAALQIDPSGLAPETWRQFFCKIVTTRQL